MFDRYSEFIKSYYLVYKASEDFKVNPKHYDQGRLTREKQVVTETKIIFDKGISDEISSFVTKYSKLYSAILEEYKQLIKSINKMETNESQMLK